MISKRFKVGDSPQLRFPLTELGDDGQPFTPDITGWEAELVLVQRGGGHRISGPCTISDLEYGVFTFNIQGGYLPSAPSTPVANAFDRHATYEGELVIRKPVGDDLDAPLEIVTSERFVVDVEPRL